MSIYKEWRDVRQRGYSSKTDSHTLQRHLFICFSLVDGGGGVWYEHDVSDDEGEAGEEDTIDGDEQDSEQESISSGGEDDE